MSAIGLPGGRAFGEVLKAQRRAKGLSLRTLALQVSMSYSYLGMLEAGPVPAPVGRQNGPTDTVFIVKSS